LTPAGEAHAVAARSDRRSPHRRARDPSSRPCR
jgi:hypothetical protein